MELLKIKNIKEIKDSLAHNNVEVIDFKEKIKFIKHGKAHIIIVTKENNIYIYGDNSFGQLGIKNYGKFINSFIKIDNLFGEIKCLECSDEFTVFVNIKNNIYLSGELRKIHISSTFIKFLHELNGEIKFIRCGFDYLFVVLRNFEIYGIGNNFNGGLGLTESNYFRTFTKLDFNEEIKDLQCGKHHSIILDKLGNIYGDNFYGGLGLEDINLKIKYNFTKIELDFKVKKISCFPNGTLLINEFNEFYGCGASHSGELGIQQSKNIRVFTKIVIENCGIIKNIFKSFDNNTAIQTKSNFINKLFVCGRNTNGKFGIDLKKCKVTSLFNKFHYRLEKFTELDYFQTKRRNLIVLMLDSKIFIVASDYKINVEDNYGEVSSLGEICLRKVLNNNSQLCDVVIKFK